MDLGIYSRKSSAPASVFSDLPLYFDEPAATVQAGSGATGDWSGPQDHLQMLVNDPRTASHPWVQQNIVDKQQTVQQLSEIQAGGHEYENRGVLSSAAAAIRRAGLTAQSLGLNAAKAVLPQSMAEGQLGQEMQDLKRQQEQYGELHGMSKSLKDSTTGMILSGVEQAPANIGGMLAMGGVGYPVFAGLSTFGEYKFQGEEAITKAEKQLSRALSDVEKNEVRDRFSGAEAIMGAATETVMEKLDMAFGVFSKVLPQQGRKAAVKVLADVLQDPKKMRPLWETVKDSVKGLAWEAGSEGLLQSGPQAAVGRGLEQQTEQQLGVKLGEGTVTNAYLKGAKEGGLSAVGMWGVGAPLSVPGKYSDEKLKQRSSEIMADPTVPVPLKMQAIEEIRQRVGTISKAEADAWADQMLESMLTGQQPAAAGTGQTTAPGGEQGAGKSVAGAPASASAEGLTVPPSQADYEMQLAAEMAAQQAQHPAEDNIPASSSPPAQHQQATTVAPAVQPPAEPAGTLTRAAQVISVNPYQQFAEQPFAGAPQQPAGYAGAAVTGLLNDLQPAAPSELFQAQQWAAQQLQYNSNTNLNKQNLKRMLTDINPQKLELVRYWRSFTGQRKQPAAIPAAGGLTVTPPTVARDSAPPVSPAAVVAPAEVQQPPAPVAEAPSSLAAVGAAAPVKPSAAPRDRTVKPAKDDLIVAIAKLGGLNKDQAIKQWGNSIKDSAKDLNVHAAVNGGVGFIHAITKQGKPLDTMRELLEEQGYLPTGSTIEDMYNKIEAATRGQQSYSNQKEYVPEEDYPFDLDGIDFPPQRDPAKHQEYMQKQLAKAKGGKAKATIRRALEKLEQNKDNKPVTVISDLTRFTADPVKLTTVYGDIVYVDKNEFEAGKKTLLRVYNSKGERIKNDKKDLVHRENIVAAGDDVKLAEAKKTKRLRTLESKDKKNVLTDEELEEAKRLYSELYDSAESQAPDATATPSPDLSPIEQEIKNLSVDQIMGMFDDISGASAPTTERSLSKAEKHKAFLRKQIAEAKHPNDKQKYRKALETYQAKQEALKQAPPKPEELPAKPEKDEAAVPFFKKGERIQITEGRHGIVSSAVTMKGTIIGMDRGGLYPERVRYSHHYDVQWDDGIKGFGSFSTMQYESDPAPAVVLAPKYKGAHIEPDQLLRNVEYKRKSARDARDAAGRARKADKISNLRSAAMQYENEAAEMQDLFDAWTQANPAEAEKYRPAPVAAVAQAPVAEPVATGDTVPGLKVSFNALKNGIELHFPGRPTDEVIARVKAQGFKWSSKQKLWYAPKTESRQAFADGLAGKEQAKSEEVKIDKPMTALDARRAAGAAAFAAGKPRIPIDPFNPSIEMTPGMKEAWLKGWDAANLAAPVEDQLQQQPSGASDVEEAIEQAENEITEKIKKAKRRLRDTKDPFQINAIEREIRKLRQEIGQVPEKIKAEQQPADRSASDIIKAAAASGVKGADEAIKGLYELFGGSALKTFPGAIDEATYAKAKPHFVSSYQNFVESGKALTEFLQFVAQQFGVQIRPYLQRFVEDLKNNDLSVQNSDIIEVEENSNASTSEIQSDDTGTAAVRGQVSAVGQGSRPAAGAASTDAEPVSGQASGNNVTNEQSLSAVDKEGDTGKPGRVRQPVESDRVEDGAGAAAGQRKRPGQDYRIPAGGLKREGSWLATARRNLEIMALTRQLAAEKRQATPAEQELLSRYTGFGASEIANNLFPGYSQHGKIVESWAKPEWKPLVDQLLALDLSPEELKTLARSTQYAHYTPEGIYRAIYSALEERGFTGGKILGPGTGVAPEIGLMPDSIYANSKYTGIEMDHLTAAIAKQLYPQQNILQADYVKQKLPRDFFDLAIGNPPFADVKILADPEYKSQRFTLHDYFFAKSLDRVRPGGLMVFITSRYTMDKVDDKARAYLSERADLVGAVRFPQTAFLQHSGTEVVTDVLFLRKKQEGVVSTGYAWGELAEVQTPEGPVKINQYYAEHPAMVLGKNSMKSTMYGPNQYTVLPDEGNIDDQFAAALKNLPQDIYSQPVETTRESKAVFHERDFNPKLKKEGGIYLDDDGLLRRVEHGSGVVLSDIKKLSARDKEWLTAYIPLRDAIKQAKYDQWNDGDWQKSLKEVNRLYQAFVKQHGNLQAFKLRNKTEQNEEGNELVVSTRIFINDNLFKLDTEGPVVRALEVIDDNGVIKPSAFLSGRTISKPAPPKIESLTDALAVSIDQLGKFDIDHVAKLAGMKRDQALEELGDLVYQTPRGKWLMADQYLSGNVVRKLEEAKVAAAADQKYQRNVEALQKVQPKPLTHTDISVKLGATWLDPGVIEEFAAEVLEIPLSVEYNSTTGKWAVSNSAPEKKDGWYYGRRGAPKAAKPQSLRQAGGEWSTEFRGPNEIIDSILNNQSIKVTYTDKDRKVHTDTAATAAVNEIAEKMRKRFSAWIWEDADRTQILLEEYNKRYNNIAPRKFDGSHLTLPGVSLKYKLHPHQKRAIWRVLQTGSTYLAHAVGAGKTIEMIAAGMEMKRLGQIAKPLYVVPNHMLEQFASEFQDLYPLAQIMVADSEDFHKDNRRRFMAQASMNNPDAIVITHSSFGKLGMHPKNVEQVRDEILSDMRDYLFELMEQEGEKSVKVKQMEKRLEAAEQRFDSIAVSDKADQAMTFEDLGVDFLFVDEAHEFRKLDFTTSRQVKGIDPNGSRKALDMYVKTRWLQGKRPGRSHVFASGTPITNTVGELYTLQKFFQHQQMDEDGIKHFDAWAAMFGEIEPGFEMNAAGRYEVVERFAKFDNLPELSKRVSSFMDVLTSDQLSAYVKRPDIKGGQPEIIVSHASPELKEFQQSVLLPRIERSKKWKPSFEERNNPDPIIAIIADGRLASIDMRFFNKEMKDDKNSKLNRMIDEIIKVHFETKDLAYTDKETGKPDPLKGGSQIVFYNNGLGAGAAKSRGFNAREWIMKRLKDAKIPVTQVAWIDDYADADKKEAMMKEVRQGQKRILFGSAKKMGTGMNVQKRLVALHYLDPPWYPADVTQPDGRILRQGNQNELVTLQRYATKGSYDATQWQMVARKAKAIEAFLNSDDSMRSIEDLSEANQFAMASALASGDERVIQLAGLNADVERLNRLGEAHVDSQRRMQIDKENLERSIAHSKQRAADLQAAVKKIGGYQRDLAGKVGTKSFDSRAEFGDALLAAFDDVTNEFVKDPPKEGGKRKLGTVNGFDVVLTYAVEERIEKPTKKQLQQLEDGEIDQLPEISNYIPYRPNIKLEITDKVEEHILSATNDWNLEETTGRGLADRLFNALNGVERNAKTLDQAREERQEELAVIKKRLGTPYPHARELAEKIAEATRLQNELAAEGQDQQPPAAGTSFSLNEDAESFTGLQAEAIRKMLPWVQAVQSVDEIPAKVLADAAAMGVKPWNIEGFLHEGKVWLVADNIKSISRAKVVAHGHELAHLGQDDKLVDLAVDWFNSTKADDAPFKKAAHQILQEEAGKRNLDLNKPADHREAVREATARLAEDMAKKGVKPGLIQKIVNNIRELLRKLGRPLRVTDQELAGAVAEMLRLGEKRLATAGAAGISLQENRLNGHPDSGIIKEKDSENAERIAKIKEGLYVPERLPQRMVGEGQKGTIGAAADVSRAVHTAMQRGRITGGSLFERHQRYKELAENYIKPQEEAALREWAQANNMMLDRAEFDAAWIEQKKPGRAEHDVYFTADKKHVIKRNRLSFHDTYLDYFHRLAAHNTEFTNVPYELIGFMDVDGALWPVVKQPAVAGRPATWAEAHAAMLKLGYEPIGTSKTPTSYHIPGTGMIVRDVSGDNSRINAHGTLYVIDPVFDHDMETADKRLMEEAGLDTLPPAKDVNQERPDFSDIDDQLDAWDKTTEFSLRSRLQEAADAIPWDEVMPQTRKEWLRTINPLDLSRGYRLFQDYAPDWMKNMFGYVGGNPYFQAERHAGMKPFVAEGEQREVTRMQIMLDMLGYNPGTKDTRNLKQRAVDFFTKWNSVQDSTDWEALNQRKFALSPAQQKALDLIFVEGDAMGSEYGSFASARSNPRLHNNTSFTKEVFDLYRDIRRHIDGPVKDARLKWMEHLMMMIPDMSEKEREKRISDLRNRIASVRGWLTRDHGEGRYQAAVYHVFTAEEMGEDWQTSTLYDKDGEVSGEQFFLPYYPGAEAMEAIETRIKQGWQEAKAKVITTAKGHVVVTINGDSQGAMGAIDVAIDEALGDKEVRVMSYMKRFGSIGSARRHIEEVQKNYKKAMPRNFAEGRRYETKTVTTSGITEDMFQEMKGDIATEKALKESLLKALKRGELDKAEYETLEQQLVQDTAEVLMSRGAGRYQIRRAPYLIEGYETENVMSLYQDYMMGTAGMLSKAAYAMAQYKHLEGAGADVEPWATTYVFDSLRNMGAADRASGDMRAFASLWFMGFKLSSALINATQPYTQGAAELGRRLESNDSALKLILGAQKDIMRGNLSVEEKQIFDTAVLKVQEMQTALGELSGHNEGGKDKASKLLHNMTSKALTVFQHVEVMNRKSVILASYRAFRNKDLPAGMIDEPALQKALEVNSSVNFEMGRHNLPGWARKPLGRTVYALQSFTWNSMNWIFNRLTSGEKRDQIALLRYAGMIALLGGAAALPGGDELDKLYRLLRGRSLKVDFQAWSKAQGEKFGTLGEMVNAFAWHGLLSAGGYGVNASNAMRMQMPVVSQMLADRTVAESLSGVPGALVNKAGMTMMYASRGDAWKATEAAAPEAVSGLMRAARMAHKGATTAGGKVIFDENGQPLKYSAGDAIKRGLGFQPYGQNKRAELTDQARKIEKHWNDKRKRVLDNLRVEAGGRGFDKALDKVVDFNDALLDSQAMGMVTPIDGAAIRRGLTYKPNKKQNNWKQQYSN